LYLAIITINQQYRRIKLTININLSPESDKPYITLSI